MMKRTLVINLIISAILAFASGSFLELATAMSDTGFGVLAIVTIIGCVLNILCGPDTINKKRDVYDEKE